jgi:hypothetical protein
MLPDFLICGAQRAGTTSLWRALEPHPAVMPPAFQKGIHYFDESYHLGLRRYRSFFPIRRVAELRTRRAGVAPITGEASPYYMFHPLAAERIARDLPDVRAIVMLRDPIERAYSAHRHELERGFEDLPFEQALDAEPERLRGEAERMRDDESYHSDHLRHHAYLARGRYVEQVQRLHDLLGRERVLAVFSEDFFATPEPVYDRVLDFLGLPSWHPASFERHNARPRSPMSDDVRARLDEYFIPYDEALSELLGRTPSWRRR